MSPEFRANRVFSHCNRLLNLHGVTCLKKVSIVYCCVARNVARYRNVWYFFITCSNSLIVSINMNPTIAWSQFCLRGGGVNIYIFNVLLHSVTARACTATYLLIRDIVWPFSVMAALPAHSASCVGLFILFLYIKSIV